MRSLIVVGVSTFLIINSALRGEAAPRVQLNGNEIRTTQPPVRSGGRVLVPMRDIFQALGARVDWNDLTREIAAQHGSASIRLQIGNAYASVNGRRVRLDQAPVLRNGTTFVPLRFVSENLGADVHWNEALQLVSINTRGTAGQAVDTTAAGTASIVLPANVVIPVRMATALSSADARRGDVFRARVRSQVRGDSEFPPGTEIEGVVVAVQRRSGAQPGLLDVQFRAAILPDRTRLPLRGALIALDSDSVQTMPDNRLMARAPFVRGRKMQFAGVGRGVGFVIGEVTRRNNRITAVRGPRGESLFRRADARIADARSGNAQAVQAVVPVGAEFGVRLVNSLSYADTGGYRLDRQQFLQNR